jgi:hypothetical protein
VTAVLIVELVTSNDSYRTLLLFFMGIFPIGASVIETYVQNTASRELRRQYDYMYDVVRSARDRLLQARTETERRNILALLGRACSGRACRMAISSSRPSCRQQPYVAAARACIRA